MNDFSHSRTRTSPWKQCLVLLGDVCYFSKFTFWSRCNSCLSCVLTLFIIQTKGKNLQRALSGHIPFIMHLRSLFQILSTQRLIAENRLAWLRNEMAPICFNNASNPIKKLLSLTLGHLQSEKICHFWNRFNSCNHLFV